MFSMKPLLAREGLLVPCFVCTMLYIGASLVSSFPPLPPPRQYKNKSKRHECRLREGDTHTLLSTLYRPNEFQRRLRRLTPMSSPQKRLGLKHSR